MNGNYPDLESLFEAVLEIQSVAERADFLDRTCKGHRQLLDEIQRLLDSDREAGSFLDAPAVTPASTMPSPMPRLVFTSCLTAISICRSAGPTTRPAEKNTCPTRRLVSHQATDRIGTNQACVVQCHSCLRIDVR